jgi:transcriptional regulator with XRE-family HTH domain
MSTKAEFGEYLRQLRGKIAPSEVGMPDGLRRRTPGLRRQEVSQLAGISIDYYIKLEQGRGSHPSGQVLGALARALVLSRDERQLLFRLAGEAPHQPDEPSSSVSTAVRFLIDNMPEVPAYVVDAAWNALAWNELAVHFTGELTQMREGDRNVARWMFRAPADDPHWHDPASIAFAQVVASDLRSAFLRYPGSTEIELLTSELLGVSQRFREMWEARDQDPRPAIPKSITIPGLGDFAFECQLLRVADSGQQIVAYCAEPGATVRDAFRRYAAAAADRWSS